MAGGFIAVFDAQNPYAVAQGIYIVQVDSKVYKIAVQQKDRNKNRKIFYGGKSSCFLSKMKRNRKNRGIITAGNNNFLTHNFIFTLKNRNNT